MDKNVTKKFKDVQVRSPGEQSEKRALEVKRGVEGLKELVEICPVPTNSELKKLLGIQGALLNNAGLDLLESVRADRTQGKSLKRIEKAFNMALKALSASREALKASAAIHEAEEDPGTGSESRAVAKRGGKAGRKG